MPEMTGAIAASGIRWRCELHAHLVTIKAHATPCDVDDGDEACQGVRPQVALAPDAALAVVEQVGLDPSSEQATVQSTSLHHLYV